MKCRKHKWNVEDPQPQEAYCEECGTLFTGKGRPRKNDSHSAATDVLQSIAADLSGVEPKSDNKRVSFGASAGDYDSSPDSDSQPLQLVPKPAPPPTWCKFAGKNIANAYKLLIEGALLRFARREAAEPEEEHPTQLGDALGEQLAIWFPDTELTPATKIAITAASMAATMVVGSRPIKKPIARSVSTSQPTADAAPTEETPMANGQAPSTDVELPRGLY